MSYLRTFGPAADPVTRLDWGLLAISTLVCVIIAALILLAIFRRRPPMRLDELGRMPVFAARSGMPWIYVGVGVSTLVLFASAIWTILTLSAVAAPAAKAAMTIEVIGHEWWWEVKYPGRNPSDLMVTANEIHIPVGVPVKLKLTSDDVIHSFWVPQLAGKTDLIPGQINYSWIQADRPGDYRGQCGEYCGAQHAHMAFHVIAEEPARFREWRSRQMQTGAARADSQSARGSQLFIANCARCHTVRGTAAHGSDGPDLTHLMSRQTIAAGMLPNNTATLSGWVANAQQLKPGALMPRMDLSPEDLHAVVTYLETLR